MIWHVKEGCTDRLVSDDNIANNVRAFVWSVRWAAVPVFWNTLLPSQPLEAAWFASHAEKGLEVVSVQVSSGNFSTVVAHEVDDKVVRSRYNNYSGEGASEVVWVVRDGLVLGLFELGSELVECIAVGAVLDSNVVDLFETSDVQRVCVTVVFVVDQ